MISRNCLGLTSLLSFGLIAACSSDSSSSVTTTDEIGEGVTNVCNQDGYSAMQGANGETLCMDAEGNLAFWINTDGSYGFPETSPVDVCNGYTSMIGDDGTTYCFDDNNQLQHAVSADGNITTTTVDSLTNSADSTANSDLASSASEGTPSGDVSTQSSSSASTCNDPVDGEVAINQVITSADGSTYMYNAICSKIVLTQPVSSSSEAQQIESSASTTCAATTTPLYTINGVSYYQSGQGYVYYFDENCNRVKVESANSSSSSMISQSSASVESSSSVIVASSSSTNSSSEKSSTSVQSSTSVASSTSVSNGSTPTITYASSGATIENDNGCVSIDGGTVTITCAGDYYFNGNGSGQIQVNAASTDKVELYLNNLTLSNSSDAPLYVRNADKVVINLESGTTNTFTDASSRTTFYTKADGTKDTTGAAIYAKDDLTIKGSGTLKVTGNYNNGIHSSNDLRVRGNPTINVTAKNNGLKGKGLVDIEGGDITIAATNGDGIKSDECTVNSADSCTAIIDGKGIVDIKGGKITITKAGDDGIQAYNYVFIRDSVSTPSINETSTGKGIVSDNRVYINAGKIDISSGDDGVHSNMNVYFNGGYTTIAAPKNDGVHADSTLMINDGTIYVTNSYEGLEAWYIKANGGITDVYGTDDAWNAAGGNDGSGNTSQGGQSNWGRGGMGGMGSSSGFLTITGGVHHAKTSSGDTDGIDSNGELTISGGVVIVECQISGGMGGSFDSDGNASLTSKTVLGFSSGSSEKGSNYSVSFSTSSYYGTSNVAFKPTISGRYMVTTTGQPSQISNVSSYSKSVTFPSGSTVYYNE